MQRKVGDLFGQLGVNAEVLQGRLGEIAKTSLKRLENLKTAYGTAALEANKFGKGVTDGRANIPPFLWNPQPAKAKTDREAFLSGTYFQDPGTAGSTSSDPFPGLMNAKTKRRTELAMLVQGEESVRSRFEKIAGGSVVLDGRMDGKISMLDAATAKQLAAQQAASEKSGVSVGALTSGGGGGYGNGPLSQNSNLTNLLMSMDAAVMEEARNMAPGASQNQFWELDVGVGSLLSGDDDSASSQFGREEDEEQEENAFPSMRRSAIVGPHAELAPQSQGGESVDTGTLRLKRLLDKRDQMYDIVNKVYEKFNSAANAAINNLK